MIDPRLLEMVKAAVIAGSLFFVARLIGISILASGAIEDMLYGG